jgi:hypothetical protein
MSVFEVPRPHSVLSPSFLSGGLTSTAKYSKQAMWRLGFETLNPKP